MPPSASDCVPNFGTSKRKRPNSIEQPPFDLVGTTISIPDASLHAASNQNADILISDELAGRASYSFDVQSENVLTGAELPHLLSFTKASLESEKHASSSIIASSILSNVQQGGEVSLVTAPMPYDLHRLFIGDDVRKNARTYNNNVSFTTFAAKYDPELTKNKHGVYTFRIQGQVYHFLDGLCIYNLPLASQVAAIWTETDDESVDKSVHIQYPLLFPCSESGWHHGIQRITCENRKRARHVCEDDIPIDLASISGPSNLINLEQRVADHGKKQKTNVTAREYYYYRFQMRNDDESMLLHALRLLQQYVVDIYVKIETSRLDFHRNKQNTIRTEALQGIMDSVFLGQTSGSKVGRRIYLPVSFLRGPRDMRRRYLDAMALAKKYGKPDHDMHGQVFLTMTCNPLWPEIQEHLKYKEKPQDRPDLLARVFRAKFEILRVELVAKKIFGDVAAYVYVIEFQKKSFPHAHLLFILKLQFKPLNPEAYDKIVSAELLDRKERPHLYSLVVRHMIHGPCGKMNKNSPCMKNSVCKNYYPKGYSEHMTHGEDSYPNYRKRKDGKKIRVKGYDLDNRWIIPYTPYLLALIDCHINVEICSTIKLVKYLYKYIFKGHDLVNFHTIADETPQDVDEIKEFQRGRWVSLPEALWRIYAFRLNEMTPAVYSLQLKVSNVCIEILLSTFVWTPAKRNWIERSKHKVIGRKAALELGLLESDSFIEATLEEAAGFQMPSLLRFLFVTLLLHCAPTNPSLLWEKFEMKLSRDFERAQTVFSSKGQSFFIDGPGGMEKIFLYRSLLATLRSQGYIAIAVATSGVATSLRPGGRTAHSRFKISLDFSKNKTCQLSKQSSMAQLIIECKLFLWDEASMAKRESIETFEELLKDVMETDDPFGGKVVIFGGDFRQTLPVILGVTKDQLIQASLLHSSLWFRMHKIKLTQNMRAVLDLAFSQFLLAVGEGAEPVDADNQICLPSHMVIPFHNMKDSFDRLIAYTFPDLNLYLSDPYEMISRCILTPKNTSVEDINEMMIQRFPGQLFTYKSSDQIVDQRFQADYEDFLNSQNPKVLPPHKLMLKENCPLILLRNLNPAEGLCNGTRLICRQLRRHTICAEIAFGQHKRKKIFIPRIPLQTPNTEKNGIPFIKTQLPVCLCFAMTINKAQGQTLDYVGVYLKELIFSHGQLYVALSRAKTANAVKVLILPGTFAEVKTDCKTSNIVFDEILQLSN
ncbi:uncharacterized protein [Coffea arabica]|uniref:ATP-dependent DNA helicase n=1 Tax=Coffea arabica TaxID=13443 RepID=A0A6P6UJ54_COFAR|nr:uncharacterized protein LOC113711336 [Coffea arabica]